MTPVEIIALIFAIGIVIKAITVHFIKPKTLNNIVKKYMTNTMMMSVLCTVLAVVIGYYLLLELTIVQIFASGTFMMMLAALLVAAYPKGYQKLAEEVTKNMKAAWYPMLVWLGVAIWVLYTLFM